MQNFGLVLATAELLRPLLCMGALLQLNGHECLTVNGFSLPYLACPARHAESLGTVPCTAYAVQSQQMHEHALLSW